jgi:peptide deformylase
MTEEIKEIITDVTQLDSRADEIDIRKQGQLTREITRKIKMTMRKKGIKSLSAPAIGYPYRIFCMDFSDSEIKTFINPIITNAEGIQLARESCNCIPGKEYIRPRNPKIKVMYQNPTGKVLTTEFVGLSAVVFQHELDHLEGLLLSDVGLEIDEQWDNASDEEKQEVITAYLDSLDLKQKELEKEISEDPDLKQMSDAIDFMTQVQKGEVTLEPVQCEE